MRRIPLLALFACAPLVASAGDEAGHFYIGPEVGGIVASGDRGTKEHDWVYGLDLGPGWELSVSEMVKGGAYFRHVPGCCNIATHIIIFSRFAERP